MLITGAVTFAVALGVLLFGNVLGLRPGPLAATVEALAIAAVTVVAVQWARSRRRHGALSPERAGIEVVARPDFDSLTRTLNQRGITTKLLELMALGNRYGNKLAIAIAGIDHTRDINDAYGRDAGDRVLRSISDVLSETVRMPDRLGRWGEDQFLIVLPETDIHGARRIAERFRETVATVEVPVNRKETIHTTISIGVTAFRRGDDLRGFVDRALRAMEAAKHQGRNRVLIDLAA